MMFYSSWLNAFKIYSHRNFTNSFFKVANHCKLFNIKQQQHQQLCLGRRVLARYLRQMFLPLRVCYVFTATWRIGGLILRVTGMSWMKSAKSIPLKTIFQWFSKGLRVGSIKITWGFFAKCMYLPLPPRTSQDGSWSWEREVMPVKKAFGTSLMVQWPRICLPM